MAESQIAGLFMTPEMYQRQQMQADRQRAAEYAQLAPEQRAAMGFFSAGQGLGRAAGTLLGAQDPQLQRITEQQQMLQGLDVSDPDSLMQAARRASKAGNVPLAMQLAQQANQAVQTRDAAMQRQLQMQQLQAQEQQRRAAAAAQGVAAGAVQEIPTLYGAPAAQGTYMDDEGNVMPGAGSKLSIDIQRVAPQLIALGAPGMAALKQLTDFQKSMVGPTQVVPENSRLVDSAGNVLVPAQPRPAPEVKPSAFAQQLIDEGLERGSPEFQRRMRAFNDAKTTGTARGTGNVSIGNIGGNIPIDRGAAGRAAGTEVGKGVAGIETQFSLQTAVKDALGILNQGIYAGAFGPEQSFAAKYAGLGNKQKVENTEVFLSNIGEIVIPRLQQFGGNDSNEELRYLQKVVAGEQRLEPGAMRRILRSAELKIQNNIKRLQKQAEGELPTGPMDQPTAGGSTPRPTQRWNPVTRKVENISGVN